MVDVVGWEHDGTLFTIKSDDIPVLQTPFAERNGQPSLIVGHEPSQQLPAYYSLSDAIPVLGPTILPVVPTTPTTCVQVRCGVASNLTKHLNGLYEGWSNWVGVALGGAAAVGTLAAFFFILDPIVDVAGGALLAMYPAIRTAISGIAGGLSAVAVPYLSTDQTDAIQNDCFCALTCTNDVCVPNQAALTEWLRRYDINPGPSTTHLMQTIIDGILAWTPLQDWLIAASTAVPITDCDAYACS